MLVGLRKSIEERTFYLLKQIKQLGEDCELSFEEDISPLLTPEGAIDSDSLPLLRAKGRQGLEWH